MRRSDRQSASLEPASPGRDASDSALDAPARLRLAAPVAGGAVVAALVLWVTRGSASAFRSTLAMLPVAVGAAWTIERWLRARGLAPLGPRSVSWLVGATAALAVAASRASRLGLAAAEPLIAIALLLVLAAWLATVLPRLLPLLGSRAAGAGRPPALAGRLPERPRAIFFWLPFVVYASLLPWTTEHRAPDGDEPYNLLIAHSLIFDRDADLANNYAAGDARRFLDRAIEPQIGDPQGREGQQYSRHNLVLPLAIALPYAVAGRYGALLAMAALTAALSWVTLRLAVRYFPRRPREVLAAWSVFSFAPPLLLYSSQIWVEVPAALLVVIALDRIHAAEADGRSWRAMLALAVPILLLPLVKIRLTLLALSLVALYGWRVVVPALRRRPAATSADAAPEAIEARVETVDARRARTLALSAVALGAVLAATAGAILLHNQTRFGNPLKVHSLAELDLTTHPVERYLRGISGLFLDAAFGLFSSAPVWLVVIPALVLLVARRHRLMVDAAFVALPYLIFVAPRGEWYGGWSPPFRYGLAFLPLLGVALARAFEDRRRAVPRVLLGALGAATVVLTLVWVGAPGWTYNFANGTSRVLDHVGAQLGLDVARLFPSYVRPRLAALWAPAVAALIALVWLMRAPASFAPARAPTAREDRTAGGRTQTRPRRRRPSASSATAIGGALLLLAGSGVLLAAARVPTRVVEVEDAFVAKSGGEVNPPMWTIDRWRHRGAWLLTEGERMVVPVAEGGEQVSIEIDQRYVRRRHPPLELAFLAGDRHLGTVVFEDDSDWSTVRVGPFDWPAGMPLVLEARGPALPPEPQRNRLVVDRLRLEWR